MALDDGSEPTPPTHGPGLPPFLSPDGGAAAACFGTAVELCATVTAEVTAG